VVQYDWIDLTSGSLTEHLKHEDFNKAIRKQIDFLILVVECLFL